MRRLSSQKRLPRIPRFRGGVQVLVDNPSDRRERIYDNGDGNERYKDIPQVEGSFASS